MFLFQKYVITYHQYIHFSTQKTYRKALELEPKNADACNNLGILLAQRGDLEEAKGFFERAVEANPSHLSAMRNLERVKGMLGN